MQNHSAIHKHHRQKKNKKVTKHIRTLDRIIDISIILAPLSLMPQLLSVWFVDDAGVSLATWLLTLVITLPLIAYDKAHSATKLVVMHSCIVLICLGIVAGILIN